jgi:hypothetical protein
LGGVATASGFVNVGLNIEGNWITEVYMNDLKMMSSTRNAFLGTVNPDIHGSFTWKRLWKARWQQCGSAASLDCLANHQNHW